MAEIYLYSGATGAGDGTSWTDAWTTSVAAWNDYAVGDIILMAHDHAETQATAHTHLAVSTLQSPAPMRRVNRTTGDYAGKPSTYNIQGTTASGDIFFNDSGIIQGVYLDSDDDIGSAQTATNVVYEDCVLQLDDVFTAGQGGNCDQHSHFKNCDFDFDLSAARLSLPALATKFEGGSVSGTFSTTGMILLNGNRGSVIDFVGVDFSGVTSGTELGVFAGNTFTHLRFMRCQLPAAYVLNGGTYESDGQFIEIWNSDVGAGGNDYLCERETYRGLVDINTATTMTGGASFEGDTAIAVTMAPSSDLGTSATVMRAWLDSFDIPFRFSGTVNTAATFTIKFIENYTTALTKKNVRFDLFYMATSGETNWSLVSSIDLDGIGAGAALTGGTIGDWGSPAGYTAHELAITSNGTTIPHPQVQGIFKAVLRLGVYESGKDLIYNPQITVS